MHIVLLGDSVFDNGAYVRSGEPDVVRQLRAKLPAGSETTLGAVDGAVAASVPGQLDRLPETATHLVVSAGGNDALRHMSVLEDASRSIADTLMRLAMIAGKFRESYAAMLQAVAARGRPTAVCTIYDPRFPDPRLQRLAVTALTLFNDAILRQAFAAGLPVLDLRLICDDDGDYANPVEPSARGGEKIADAIHRLCRQHPFEGGRSSVFVG
jgi:lysophospholipase L1-like esterase